MLRLLALLICAPAAAQTTWHVDVSGIPPGTGTPGNPYTSLQYAIDQPTTVDGDTLLVAPGAYLEAVDLGTKFLTVRSSAGPLATTLRLPPGATGFTVRMDTGGLATLEGFTVAGRAEGGTSGVFVNLGSVIRCVVSGHRAASGSGGLGVLGFGLSTNNLLSRSTLVDNDVGVQTGAFSTFALGDCVLDGNDLDLFDNANGILVDWSAWATQQGSVFGSNNILGDPGLWNPLQGDPRLAPQSPCIDSANPALPPDPDGSPADRGAVPFDAAYLPPITIYCTSKVNSAGCPASISVSGGPAASLGSTNPFTIGATDVVQDVPGLLFYGSSGRRAVPFFGGFHCVQPPTPRTAAQLSGSAGSGPCKGSFAFDFNAYLKTPLGALLSAGQVVDAQYWYRDPADPFAAATSDAVEFPIVP